jgi:hypothetical protein
MKTSYSNVRYYLQDFIGPTRQGAGGLYAAGRMAWQNKESSPFVEKNQKRLR